IVASATIYDYEEPLMTMRAFAVDEFGAPGAIHQLPVPEPAAGEVLVRVHAAGVNVMDPIYTAGWMKDYMEHRFPLVPGIDLSGVVERVGAGVDRFAAGDEVYGIVAKPIVGEGTFADSVVVKADSLAPKPASLTHKQAAAIPHVGLTALAAVEASDPQPGQVVMVVGASGGVGSFVTQLAAARGATVVAVASGPGAAQAREYGASDAVDYSKGDVVEQLRSRHPEGVDALIDLHSDADVLARYGEAVRSGGVVVSPRGPAAAAAPMLQKHGVRFVSANRLPALRLPDLTALIDGGQLRVPPIKSFPLEEASAAIAEMAGGHVRGKLVIEIA
ncbi:MAG: NADP-dependent oxidoreductase, partial [Chloroflexota bacterium]|nr:NADP-dependent oxidoreductase [Chloroflexota bacterium]